MSEFARLEKLRTQLRPAEFAAVLAVLLGHYAIRTIVVLMLASLAMLAVPAVIYTYGKHLWDSRERTKQSPAVDQFSAFRQAQRRHRPVAPRRWKRSVA